MAEYIEREKAKDVMALIVLEAVAHPDTYTCGEAKRAIESIPTADVQPVKHGTGGQMMYDELVKTLRNMSKMGTKYGMAVVKMREAADIIEKLSRRETPMKITERQEPSDKDGET